MFKLPEFQPVKLFLVSMVLILIASSFQPVAKSRVAIIPQPLGKVYHYEPVPKELKNDKVHHILGARENVWTQYMRTGSHIEFMILPGMPALSEVWSPAHLKDYPSFILRVKEHTKRYDYLNMNYATHIFEE